jgi:polyhydroxyalkanoate synthesis regulator phasin
MDTTAKRKLVAGAAVALVVAGGGVAVGAKAFSSPKRESQAVIADAAKQLGVEPAQLSAALKSALKHRIDAAVESGRLTKAQGDALVAAAHKKVDEAVAAGRLTRAEADSLLTGLERRITDFVNGRFPRPFRHHPGMRGFRGGPPGMFGPPRRRA